jgi:hypothetical protein
VAIFRDAGSGQAPLPLSPLVGSVLSVPPRVVFLHSTAWTLGCAAKNSGKSRDVGVADRFVALEKLPCGLDRRSWRAENSAKETQRDTAARAHASASQSPAWLRWSYWARSAPMREEGLLTGM